jgi:serine/threonine-protein kinase RsbT
MPPSDPSTVTLSAAARRLDEALSGFVSAPNRRAMLRSASARHGLDLAALTDAELPLVVGALESALRMFVADPSAVRAALAPWLARAVSPSDAPAVVVEVRSEQDILRVRGEVRAACQSIGGSTSYVTRVLTAASELARNIQLYAGSGRVSVQPMGRGDQVGIEIIASDEGPGIADIDAVLSGRHKSKLGMGAGLRGTRALVDVFEIETGAGRGTRVRIVKWKT